MNIDTQTFKDALSIVKNALGSKADIFSGIDNFAFQKDHISAFNSIMSVSVALETGIECCVHGAELLKLVAKFDNDKDTTLEHTDKGLRITNGRSHPTLAWHYGRLIDYLSARQCPESSHVSIPDNFLAGIDRTLIRGNKSEAAGVYIHDDYMFATNLNSVTKMYRWGGNLGCDIIIPQSVCEFIASGAMTFDTYYLEKRNETAVMLHLFSASGSMTCNLGSIELWKQRGLLLSCIGGSLPNGKEVRGKLQIAKETPIAGKFGQDFIDCVGHCSILSDKNNGKEFVTLVFDKDHMTVKGSNVNGTASEEISGDWDIDETLGSCFTVEAVEDLFGDVGFVKNTMTEVPYIGLVVTQGDLTVCVMPLCREWRG